MNVLFKDILHCPDMGLMLVSIGKITAASYKVIFRGMSCRIYDPKDKIIGQINAKNGLYHVDHGVVVDTAMTGEVPEVVSIEEIHRRMGHIAPETIKQMVSKGVIQGVEINSTMEIQQCDSCEYAKAT